ncbi:hypothetical protein RFI_33962, partial [Reticulomyxa filosa]
NTTANNTNTDFHKKDASPHYYLLLGECPTQRYSHSKAFVDSKQWIERLQVSNQHWEVHNIATDTWLSRTYKSGNYSHQDLLDFTKQQLTQLDVTKDKFQWIFSVDCSQIVKHVKPYYMSWYKQNKSESLQLFPTNWTNCFVQVQYRFPSCCRCVAVHKYTLFKALDQQPLLGLYYIYIYIYICMCKKKEFQKISTFFKKKRKIVFDIEIQLAIDNGIDWRIIRNEQYPESRLVLWIQGIFQRDMSYGFKPLQKELYNQLINYSNLIISSNNNNNNNNNEKIYFCAISTKTFYSSRYYMDSLFRHLLVYVLSQRYSHLPQCTYIGGYQSPLWEQRTDPSLLCNVRNPKYTNYGPKTSHHLLPLCFRDFQFSINFENTITYGYTSEKIYTGLLGGGIPIYLGNIDIAQLVNLDRIIVCNLTRFYDDEYIASKRYEFNMLKSQRRFNDDVHADANATQKSAFDPLKMLTWLHTMFGDGMNACVDDIVRVYQNKTLYRWKLAQPSIPNNSFRHSHYDGSVIADEILHILHFFRSPLFQ